MTFDLPRAVVNTAIDDRAFPAAVAEVGTATDVLWRESFGRLTYEPDAAPARDDTVFDLASLTKVMATARLGGSSRPSASTSSDTVNTSAPLRPIASRWARNVLGSTHSGGGPSSIAW